MQLRIGFLAVIFMLPLVRSAMGQEFPWITQDKITRIDAQWTNEKIKIDGKLDEKIWSQVAPSP